MWLLFSKMGGKPLVMSHLALQQLLVRAKKNTKNKLVHTGLVLLV